MKYAHMVDPGAMAQSDLGIAPIASAAATVNGPAIDRTGFMGANVIGLTGVATGTPTTQSTIYKLQDSEDGSTGWADYGTAAAALTANGAHAEISQSLRGAKKFIRVSAVVSFTGGTSPTQLVAAAVSLTGPNNVPAS